MTINYNKIKYIELLRKKPSRINAEEENQLSKYSCMTNDHFNWCIRNHYLDFLENFQKGKIKLQYIL